jgi:acyl-CoA thioesterase
LNDAINALKSRFEVEPYALKLGMKLIDLEPGRALVELTLTKELENIFGTAHGGAIFSLIDGAFELAANSHGTVAVAVSVNIAYHSPAVAGDILRAEAKEIALSRKLSTYAIRVTCDERLVATCQAVAYRKKDLLPRP